ncbi:MAG: class I SAM-dependent methyltransferase, partial [Lentisphaeria bacterium]|nr:class I SAM-dependent methyltransferase [Lentisphaeria bacterium]
DSFDDKSMHIIDPKQSSHWHDIGRQAFRICDMEDKIEFYQDYAHTALPEILKQGTRIQLAFIDGWHLLDYVMLEAFYCDKMMDPGGLIILHDMYLKGLQHFAAFWTTNHNYEAVTLQNGLLTTKPFSSISGKPFHCTEHFKEHLEPYVSDSMIVLRKIAEDTRKGMDYTAFV